MAARFAGLVLIGSVRTYVMVVFVFGGLHVFYDGFIWKLRRAEVARGFDQPTVESV